MRKSKVWAKPKARKSNMGRNSVQTPPDLHDIAAEAWSGKIQGTAAERSSLPLQDPAGQDVGVD